MGRLFDDDGRVRDREALRSVQFAGKAPPRKVTTRDNGAATFTTVETDHAATVTITPRTAEYDLTPSTSREGER